MSTSTPDAAADDAITYDETKWMAVAIELLVVVAAVVFAFIQSA